MIFLLPNVDINKSNSKNLQPYVKNVEKSYIANSITLMFYFHDYCLRSFIYYCNIINLYIDFTVSHNTSYNVNVYMYIKCAYCTKASTEIKY